MDATSRFKAEAAARRRGAIGKENEPKLAVQLGSKKKRCRPPSKTKQRAQKQTIKTLQFAAGLSKRCKASSLSRETCSQSDRRSTEAAALCREEHMLPPPPGPRQDSSTVEGAY